MPIKETVATTVSTSKSLTYIPALGTGMFMCDFLYLKCNLVGILLAMMILDFIAGWYKSIQLGKPLTVKRFRNGVMAKLIMFIALISLGLLIAALNTESPEMVSFFDMTSYITGITIIMIASEFLSIWDNLIAGYTKEETKEIDLFAVSIRKIRNKVAKIFDVE